jgi:hypothetical protein
MAEADLDGHKTSMAGTTPAVAYFWKSTRTVAWYEPQPKRVGTPRASLSIFEKGGETMPIKWNALQVAEAVNMVEEYVNQAIEPLEQAKLVAAEARNITHLPGYIDQHLSRLITEIERVTGGIYPWNQQPHPGNVRAAISSIRDSIPRAMVDTERRKLESGKQLSLVR